MLRVWNGPPFLQLLSVFTKINEAELIGFFLPPPTPTEECNIFPSKRIATSISQTSKHIICC